MAVNRDASSLEAGANALGNTRHHFHWLWNDRGKFLAAQPADDIAGAHAFANGLGEYLQHTVADAMAKAVVDRLEMIEIEHQQLSLIHISEPTRRTPISYAVFC